MTPERLPRIFDPTNAYREMGLLTDGGPLGFVGTARILAGPSPDSLVLVVALSMRNRGLAFRRDGEQFVAEYRVESLLRRGGRQVANVTRDERVRVTTFRETQRSDESIIFQQFLYAPPGEYTLSVGVRDRNGANSGQVEVAVTVPVLSRTAFSLPIAVYDATPRTSLSATPTIVVNARAAAQYGVDTLRYYVESYSVAPGTYLTLAAVDGAGRTAWTDSVLVDSAGPVRGYVAAIPPSALSIGRYELHLSQRGTLMAATPFLVSFSDQFAAANLADIVSLLRYFAPAESLRVLLNVPPEERSAAWQRFWRRTDPNPQTQENEAIEQYLQRVQVANERFTDEGLAGWLTERGEVFIQLGEPSEIYDRRGDMQARGSTIVWNYYEMRLSLYFYDDAGFGRYRLDPRSRSEFQRIVNRSQDR